MKLIIAFITAIGFAGSAYADHGAPGRGVPEPGYSGDLVYTLDSLVNAAQSEAYEARSQRNSILAQKYVRMEDLAKRMSRNVAELYNGSVYDPDRYYYDLRVKTHDIEQIARSIQYLPYYVSQLVYAVRAGVDDLTEGGNGGSIEFPGEHGGGHHGGGNHGGGNHGGGNHGGGNHGGGNHGGGNHGGGNHGGGNHGGGNHGGGNHGGGNHGGGNHGGGNHGGGNHGYGQYQAQCDVTLVGRSTFSLSVSGNGNSQWQAIEAAKSAGARQCAANNAQCYFGQCQVVRLR